jgi:arginyl-tRNA synthetase
MIKDLIEQNVKEALNVPEIQVEVFSRFADFAINPSEINRLSENLKISKEELARKIEERLIDQKIASRAIFQSGFINIELTDEIQQKEAELIISDLGAYLIDESNTDKNIIFDYSQPNIAKPFSVGHLRSTVIGQANLNIHKALGYKTFGINHIGDWGTQFGKLIYAVTTWGDESKIESDPINELVALYQKFHREAEENPELNKLAADWFRKLELKDEEATELWKKCIKWSFAEFDRLYKILGVEIDETVGESFYADKTDAVISELKEKSLLKESEGAQIVELENMPPAIIQKSNESTLYMTRDLAAIKYRVENYKPNEIIYHVGNDQSLHFQQLFAVARKLGWAKDVKLTFAGHGMMRLESGKMSTRAGRVVLLDDLIGEAKERVEKVFAEHSASADQQKIQDAAVSAIKYADLSTNRKSDVVFSFERLIDLKGNSAIYLQYTYARLRSLAKEYEKRFGELRPVMCYDDQSSLLIKKIIKIKYVLVSTCANSTPNTLTEYLFELANEFNRYYENNRILDDDQIKSGKRASLCSAVERILGRGLDLLSVNKFEEI